MLKIETENDERNYISDIDIDDRNYLTEMKNTTKEICMSYFLMEKALYYLTSSITDFKIYADYENVKNEIYNLPNSIKYLDIGIDDEITLKYIKIPFKTKTLNLMGSIKKIRIPQRCLLKYNENYYGKINYKTI